jgi:hypothetical protein
VRHRPEAVDPWLLPTVVSPSVAGMTPMSCIDARSDGTEAATVRSCRTASSNTPGVTWSSE